MKPGKQLTPEALAVLVEIEKTNGTLAAQEVVNHARDPASPLHEYFEWDPSKAHAEYLILQARALIRIVKIEVTVEERTIKAPKYVKDPRQGLNPGYVTVTKVKKQGDMARDVMLAELRRALAILKRAQAVGAAIGSTIDLSRPIADVGASIEELDPALDEAVE